MLALKKKKEEDEPISPLRPVERSRFVFSASLTLSFLSLHVSLVPTPPSSIGAPSRKGVRGDSKKNEVQTRLSGRAGASCGACAGGGACASWTTSSGTGTGIDWFIRHRSFDRVLRVGSSFARRSASCWLTAGWRELVDLRIYLESGLYGTHRGLLVAGVALRAALDV